jgi:metal-responsive CopG/Arc/MetJ family transcriptional regulator
MKVAVSLPDPVFDAAERLAQQLKVPRSQLYAEALTAYLGTHGAAAITKQLNALYVQERSNLDAILGEAQSRPLQNEAW